MCELTAIKRIKQKKDRMNERMNFSFKKVKKEFIKGHLVPLVNTSMILYTSVRYVLSDIDFYSIKVVCILFFKVK